jgi:hypothetical protein
MKTTKTIFAAALIACMSTAAMAQGGAGGAGGGGGGGAAAGNDGGAGGDLNPHRIGRGADDNPSMPGARRTLGNTAASPSERYGGKMRSSNVSRQQDPRWNGGRSRTKH